MGRRWASASDTLDLEISGEFYSKDMVQQYDRSRIDRDKDVEIGDMRVRPSSKSQKYLLYPPPSGQNAVNKSHRIDIEHTSITLPLPFPKTP